MQHDYSSILDRLSARRNQRGWVARCPVHGDGRPSLNLWIGPEGQLRVQCLANKGCTFREIAAAIGTTASEWFPDHGEKRHMDPQRRIVATYDYFNLDGELVYQVVRFEPKDFRQRRPDGAGGWIWDMEGVHRVPYRLPEVHAKPPDFPIIIVEGEKDADALWKLGLPATTNVGGAGKWTPGMANYLTGRRCVIIPDNDLPGTNHAIHVAGELVYANAASVRIVFLPGLPPKGDVSDWLEARRDLEPGGQRAKLAEIIKAIPEWRQQPPAREVQAKAA